MGGNEKILRVFLTGINGYLGGVLAEHFSRIIQWKTKEPYVS